MHSPRRSLGLSLCGWAALAFLYVPVLVLAVFSLNSGGSAVRWETPSLRWYGELLDPAGTLNRTTVGLSTALALSLRLGAAAAVIGVVLAALTAVGLRGAPRFASVPLLALWALPIVLPDVVLGVSWSGAFRVLGFEPGFATLALAHGTMAAAFALVVVQARLASLDPGMLEAARDLGATRMGAIRHVVLPHLRPALVAGALLGFTLSFDDFMVTLFVSAPGSPTLPISVYGIVVRPEAGARPVLNALATLSLVGTLVLGFVALRLLRPSSSTSDPRL